MGALCLDEYPVPRNIQNVQAHGHRDPLLPFPRFAETDPDHLVLKRVRILPDPQKAVGAAHHGGKSGKGGAGRQVLEQAEAKLPYERVRPQGISDEPRPVCLSALPGLLE